MPNPIASIYRTFCKLWLRVLRGAVSRLQKWGLCLRGAKFAGKVRLPVWLEPPVHAECLSFGEGAALDERVTLLATNESAQITIGARCYVNRNTMLDASERIEIGDDTMIGPFCYITDHDHTFGPGARPADGALISAPVKIGARCWLGAHVTVLKGVSIGDGTVVGAGSVVTQSLPAGVLAVGTPARVVRELA